MRKEDCLDLLKKRIPEDTHPQVNFCLRNGMVLSMDSVARFEEQYVVFRGREGGTSDEGRAFFLPYDEICYIRIERIVRMGELKKMYGEGGFVDAEDRLSGTASVGHVSPAASPSSPQAPVPTPAPVSANDPAAIAKQNLLNRIRAARANVAGTSTNKLGGG
ncbi:hypothetical protein [Gemmata sp.]|uniref:hypothetical protein n=1 Tax=Gemmata sp. TaxID=1914242 RepID=UPI003F71EF93